MFIAGGIVPRFLEFFKASGFRAAFEDKGRFKEYVHDIPVYLIVHDNPASRFRCTFTPDLRSHSLNPFLLYREVTSR